VQRLKKRRVSDCHEFVLTLTKFPGQAENFFLRNFFSAEYYDEKYFASVWDSFCIANKTLRTKVFQCGLGPATHHFQVVSGGKVVIQF
jgi:hypothetical protein